MRIALFGGSFDPPHLGHLRIAQAAADRLQLDRVLLAPVAVQPLKQGQQPPPAGFADRMAMVELLLRAAGDPRLEVSSLDGPRPDGRPNYTYETLAQLRASLSPRLDPGAQSQDVNPESAAAELGSATNPIPATKQSAAAPVTTLIPAPIPAPIPAAPELFLLTGADSLLTLAQWHRALELVLSTTLVIATRPGFPLEELSEPLLRLLGPGASLLRSGASLLRSGPSLLQSGASLLGSGANSSAPPAAASSLAPDDAKSLGSEPSGTGVERLVLTRSEPAPGGEPQTATIYLLTGLREDISATAIRACLAAPSLAEKATATLPAALSPAVEHYIRAHGLYRSPNVQATISQSK